MHVTSNVAGKEGGGVCGAGWAAELEVAAGQSLVLEANAARDGGGAALMALARLKVQPLACPEHCAAKRANRVCDLEVPTLPHILPSTAFLISGAAPASRSARG